MAIRQERDRIAAAVLWPGFDARRIPLAIFDGETTWLFGHPSPPAGFREVVGQAQTWSSPGRHPEVRSNTSTDVGGTTTATVLALGRESPTELAKTAVHEAFHVFQSRGHPGWGANEMDLFVYPFDDADALALRRLEFGALRAALAETAVGEAARWARAAVALRRERFARLPPAAVAYERGTELKEGLAQYIGDKGLGPPPPRRFPDSEFAASEVRTRSYASGQAWAVLLDRFDPSWSERLESGDRRPLDELLSAALPPVESPTLDREPERARARSEVEALRAERTRARDAYLGQPGWTLVVVAEAEPLWPRGFDPWNVQPLGGAEVLHGRLLTLGNRAGVLDVLDRPALTAGASDHPLANGVRRVVLAGLEAEPVAEPSGDRLHITGRGFTAALTGARVERSGRTTTVRLGE